MDHPRKNDRLALIKKKKKKSKGDKISMNIISGVMERLVSDLKGNVDTERKAKEIQLKREEEIKVKQEEERLLEESKERLSYQETGKLSLEELKVLFNRLDYNTFITIVMIGEIRGKHLIALYYGSKKLREYCDRSFQPVNKDGRSIDQFNNNSNNNQYNKNSYDQYLFRLLLNQMNLRIPFGKSPRQFYIERTIGGRVYVFGYNKGYLGMGLKVEDNINIPTLNPYLNNIVQTKTDTNHSLCLDNRGHVWVFGNNHFGQLGIDDTPTVSIPKMILSFNNIIEINTGYGHSLCLDNRGRVWAFGKNNVGQLGLGDIIYRNSPTVISTLSDIVQIACGNLHSLFLDQQGRVWSCGENRNGQLGFGEDIDSEPWKIPLCLFGSTRKSLGVWIKRQLSIRFR